MTRIERSIEINQPPERVFDLLIDLDRLPDWATIVVENHDVPNNPIRNGDTFRQTIRIAGRNFESEWRVAELERPRHVAYEATTPGGGQMTMKQTVRPSNNGSRVELEIDYELPGGLVGELINRVYVERRNEREVEHSLQNLKELLEGSQVG